MDYLVARNTPAFVSVRLIVVTYEPQLAIDMKVVFNSSFKNAVVGNALRTYFASFNRRKLRSSCSNLSSNDRFI